MNPAVNRMPESPKPQGISANRPRPNFFAPMLDKFAMIPTFACVFSLIVAPLLLFLVPPGKNMFEARLENRIFWPIMAAISMVLFVTNRYRPGKLNIPPHIKWLVLYLAFAGASSLWALAPESSFIRFIQQAMVVTSIVLPSIWAARTADMMRGLYLCFAFALILNVPFVLGGFSTIVPYASNHGSVLVNIGYQGYFLGKNYLGECAAIALLLTFNEMLYPGWRRAMGIIVGSIAILLLFLSNSKTALGLAMICPLLAGIILITRKITRVSPAIIVLTIPLIYFVLSSISNFNINRIAYMLYGDSTLTGRTIIWDFAQYEIARSPLLGWGYQSFWLVPGSPAIEAPGWVKGMPNAHNGYYDTMLEMGYLGLAFLLIFIMATLHAIGRVADRDRRQARLVLSLALFIIFYNYFESYWMRGFEFLWVVFLIVAAEIGRYWRPFPLRRAVSRSRSQTVGISNASPGARLRLGIGLS
jgi:exopolysaccharide production protein ExoQ